MRRTSIILAGVLLALGVSCTGSIPGSEAKDAASKRAQQTAERLTGELLGELTAAMKEGGPIRAIRYCSGNAQELTAEVGREMGVSVRRVTIKPRNSADAPDDWERQVLDKFDASARKGLLQPDIAYEEVTRIDGRNVLRSMKPIIIRQPCLMCHGTERDIPADVDKLLKERYPDDQATGYVVGDFRGAVSVIVPMTAE